MTFFCFSDATTVTSSAQDGGSGIPQKIDLTAYDLIMLDVDDIRPSPLTTLVLPHPVPEPVCEMQTPALFTMAHASPQPHFVDSANHARVNTLLSHTTSSLSSGKFRLYIESDTSPPTQMRPPSLSQQLRHQGSEPVPQSPQLFSLASQPPFSVPQPTIKPPHSSSRADEVAAEHSGRSIAESLVPNWAHSGEYVAHAHVANH